jgi:hypothetical protein
MKVMWKLAKTTGFAIPNVRLRMNTTNTLTGATLLATSTMSTTNRTGMYLRHFDLIGGTINGFDSAAALGSDITTSNANPTTNTYNTSNILYLFTTIQLNNISDSISTNFVNVTN